MAKGKFISFMPLYSIQAWGRFYGAYPFGYEYQIMTQPPPSYYGFAIYQRRHTSHGIITIREKYYTPYNPRTPKQQANRMRYRDGVSIWKSLTHEDHVRYYHYRYPERMSGYNKFLHYYLKFHS